MKRIVIVIFAVISFGVSLRAQTAVYSKENNFGFGSGFLPAEKLAYVLDGFQAPALEPSPEDMAFYCEGLRLRGENPEVLQEASRLAEWSANALVSFSEAAGVAFSPAETPCIWNLVTNAAQDTENLVRIFKGNRFRPRPYVYYHEGNDAVADRELLRGTSSTPSGHAALGATITVILLELFPDRAPEIIRQGRAFEDARWILGFHWVSDVRLGHDIGTAVVTILHSDPLFLEALEKAKLYESNH